MRIVALLSVSAFFACKEKQDAPTPATTKPAAPVQAPAPKPSLPAESTPAEQPKPTKPIAIDEAKTALPALGGKEIIALKQTSDGRQVHGTWCLDGTGADDVAKQVGHSLASASYTGLAIRGDARKAGVTGEKGEIRFSMVVSASSASVCAAPTHYFASATIFKP